jgi:hypothetical protein
MIVRRAPLKTLLLSGIVPLLLFAPDHARAQPQPVEPIAPEERARIVEEIRALPPGQPLNEEQRSLIVQELRTLQAGRQDMQRQLGEFDGRIAALEAALGLAPPAAATATVDSAQAQAGPADPSRQPVETAEQQTGTEAAQIETASNDSGWGPRYEPGRGFVLVREDEGELGAGVFSYVRYLNQTALDETYTDSFGRTLSLSDIRNDLQMQKVSWNFKGWLLDPDFRYYFFFWTSNSQMGEGAQVVIGGYFQYRFSDLLTVTAGVMPLPTTRSTNYTFPNWLRNDNRIMADEFFRGSYSTGIDAQGEIARGLRYRVALANNLAQLGVSSQELDASFNTFSGALWWMPTTGEFGQASGFGDYDQHEEVATLIGAHYTRSRENAQGQPEIDDFENSQIRLSDGTLLFSPDPFNTGTGFIREATYQMAAFNAGVKYRGFSLEGEYYLRWVDDFDVVGTLPVDELYDHGYSLQASGMFVPRMVQGYATWSQIFGEYGDPTELALGLNIYPFRRREVRWNIQALLLNRSPVGGTSLPMVVGGDGWVFSSDWIVAF